MIHQAVVLCSLDAWTSHQLWTNYNLCYSAGSQAPRQSVTGEHGPCGPLITLPSLSQPGFGLPRVYSCGDSRQLLRSSLVMLRLRVVAAAVCLELPAPAPVEWLCFPMTSFHRLPVG